MMSKQCINPQKVADAAMIQIRDESFHCTALNTVPGLTITSVGFNVLSSNIDR